MDIQPILNQYLDLALAPRTASTYSSAWKSYAEFCRTAQLQPLPVLESNLLYFITTSATRNISHQSLKVYLSGISHHALRAGHPFNVSNMNNVYLLLRGIRRSQGDTLTRPPRPPISSPNMLTLFQFIRFCHPIQDGLML